MGQLTEKTLLPLGLVLSLLGGLSGTIIGATITLYKSEATAEDVDKLKVYQLLVVQKLATLEANDVSQADAYKRIEKQLERLMLRDK